MRRLTCLALTCCLIRPFTAFGWWETGHQTVARVAAAHLTPAARAKVAEILDVPDTQAAVAEALVKASTWADETKNETKTGDWHYIDLTLQDRKSDIPLRCKDDNCAPARIALFSAQLANRPADARWSQLDALRFLVHFVGDIHQPMHAISDADLGGNCERLDPPIDTARNLHALWDGGIIKAMDMDDKALAASLEQETRPTDVERGNEDDWTWESHKIAMKDIYAKLHVPTEPPIFPANCGEAPATITEFHPQIDSLYVDSMKRVVREQLLAGGLRLAKLLNQAFAG
jgi:hypothetical protein